MDVEALQRDLSSFSSPLFSSISIENKHINFITNTAPSPRQHAPNATPILQKRTLRLELTKPSRGDTEAFDLYRRYEENTFHKSSTPKGFFSFLGDSTLHAVEDMGTFWLKWYIDEKLVAVSVLDILPHTVVRVGKGSE